MQALLSLLFVFAVLPLAGQQATKFKLEDVATIEVPNALELQSKDYQEKGREYYEKFNFYPVPGRAVFQQLGVNDLDRDALSLYVRIIHETRLGAEGDFPEVGVDPEVSDADIAEVNAGMKAQMMQTNAMGFELTRWIGTEMVILNGQHALHVAYERRMNSNPVVRVDRYSFFNNDRMQVLTLSYRLSETARWQPILESALNSYRIIR
jgi:hypothetical protein